MIRLHDDCLIFQTTNGDLIPCSAQVVAVEMVGDFASVVHPHLVQEAASAVLHYFKHDLKRQQVTVQEFSLALERILRGFGLNVVGGVNAPASPSPRAVNLEGCVREAEGVFELGFFPRIRDELRKSIGRQRDLVLFCGLRGCVKRLLGRKRWSRRCDEFSDQIVDYLRLCLSREDEAASCGLIVR